MRIFRGLAGFVVFLSAVVTIVLGWPEFTNFLSVIQNDVGNLFVGLTQWLVSPISLPVWMFFLMMALALSRVLMFVTQQVRNLRKSTIKKVTFRGLWLLLQIQSGDKPPKVLNAHLDQARCGECFGRIVGTDGRSEYQPFSYLRCENGHFVGGKVSHEELKRQRDLERDKVDQLFERTRKERQEAQEALMQDYAQGKITEKEFLAMQNAPPERSHFPFPLNERPSDAFEVERFHGSPAAFYSLIISDFLDKYAVQRLKALDTMPSQGASSSISDSH